MSGTEFDECLVSCNDILSILEKDKIPSIDTPIYAMADVADISGENARIIGLIVNGIPIAYPYEILDYHEIVNEVSFGDFRVSYCPLTASGLVYNASEFDTSYIGTSGYLYENNLVFYDRISDNYWSQMLSTSLVGNKMGQHANIIPSYEMTWGAWKALYPNTQILTRQTNYTMDYDLHPYAAYETDEEIHFRSSFDALRYPYLNYHPKETVLYLPINEQSYIFPFSELATVGFVEFEVDGINLLALYDIVNDIAEVYEADVNGNKINLDTIGYQKVNSKNFTIFVDTDKAEWNILGNEINSNTTSRALTHMATYNAYWFAVTAFFNNSDIFVAGKGFQTWQELIPEISDRTRPVFTDNNTLSISNSESTIFKLTNFALSVIIIATFRIYFRKIRRNSTK